MAIKAAATKQRELTKRLSPHKAHTNYGDFGMSSTFEPSGAKTGRHNGSGPQARNLSHMERVALQKQILANNRSRKTFDVSVARFPIGPRAVIKSLLLILLQINQNVDIEVAIPSNK